MNIPYQIVKSDRKTIAIQIQPDGRVIVRCPRRMRTDEARRFVESKADWIEKHLAKRQNISAAPKFTPDEIEQLREQARKLVTERVQYYAPIIGVSYGRLATVPNTLAGAAAAARVISISITYWHWFLWKCWIMLWSMSCATRRK